MSTSLTDENPTRVPPIVFDKLNDKKLKMGSGKSHNPWLSKSRMFGETVAEDSGL